MFFFKSRPIIASDVMHWVHETYKWLFEHFPAKCSDKDVRLIIPSREFFPLIGETDEERVKNIFMSVLRLSGMEDWPCVLEVQEEDPDPHVAPTVLINNAPQGPAGTFRLDEDDRAIISFNINLVHDNWALVSTFAHELAHYLTYTAKAPPPGGWDNWEFATDLTAIYQGFGVFLANSSFSFQQFTDGTLQGWSSKRQGYLSENEILYGLAIYVLLYGLDEKLPLRYLKDSLKGRYKKALKYINTTDVIAELTQVKKATAKLEE